MRTTKSKKPITVVSVCVAAVACAVGAYRFVYLPLRPADVSHARISINATGKFDESQIDGAVKADLARLKSWNGCRVGAVRYDAKRSTAIDEYGMDNVVYLSNDISCHAGSQNSSQDGWGSWYAWNPGSARAEHGWIFIDEGY